MKKHIFAVAVFVLCLALVPEAVLAQTQADEEELVKSLLQTGKKAIIIDNMGFTEGERKSFWPVYNEFQQAKQKLNERTIKALMDYMNAYDTMLNEKADALIKEYVAIEKERTDLKATYLPKFMKNMRAKKVARYYQIENKLEAIIKYELAKEVPLVK